jgi:hypothetical protein
MCQNTSKTDAVLTDSSNDVMQSLLSRVYVENLLLPVILVVGKVLDQLQIELVTMFTCLARTVFYPTELNDVKQQMLNHVKLDEIPSLRLSCKTTNTYR